MKNLLAILILSIGSLAFAQVPTTNLVAEYKFTNGRLDNAVGGDPFVQTGNASIFEDNRALGPSKALKLNGDHLQRPGFSSRVGSMSFWIKTTTNDGTPRVIFDQSERTVEADNSSQKGWYAYLKDGKIGVAGNYNYGHFSTNSPILTGYYYTNATSDVTDGNWHHIAITGEGTNGSYLFGGNQFIRYVRTVYKVYIDGVLENTNTVQVDLGSAIGIYMNFLGGGDPITIANSKFENSTNRYQDSFDDFRVYNRILNATEVTQLANETACSGTSGVQAIVQDIIVQLDASGNATITTDDVDNGSNAVCDEPFVLSLDITDFTCDDLGANTVTLTATETFAGQATSATTATVTVAYTPEVTAQSITVELDGSGNATITPADVNNGTLTTSVCGTPLTLSLDISTFDCNDLGANSVTLSADDGNGNMGTSTINVQVEDNVEPAIVSQNIAVMVDAMTGFVTINAAMIDNGSTDNCDAGSLTLSLSKTKFTCEDTGDNTVTLSVEDTNGNIATEEVTVTVTSEINDETVTTSSASFCPDGNSGATISTGSSIVGFDYSLRNSEDNSLIDGPFGGTGSSLDFATGNISETTTYNVYAEKQLQMTQTALEFDGVNEFVSIGTDNRGVSTQITLAAWIKSTAITKQFFMGKYNGVNGILFYFDANGKAKLDGRDGGGYKSTGASTTSVNDGQWHYVTGTINTATGAWKIYVDGVLENTTTNAAGTTLASATTFTLGSHTTFYFNGSIDQVTIWNAELDATAIGTDFSTCLTGMETNVVGHFDFDDGTGTTLTDESATGIDGLLGNMEAIDWIMDASPSCGDKACDYQLSTEITVGDDVAPTAIARDIIIQLDLLSGEESITADMIDNGSSDNCAGALIKSISQSVFTCEDAGDQIITLTIEDISGNIATATSTVTVESPIDDETITALNSLLCPDGSSTTISTESSVSGVKYYLRDSNDDSIIDGPIIGTGSGIDFNTGAISETTTFNVYADQSINNEAMKVAGSSGYVSVPNSPSLRLSSDWTLEAWVKPTGPTVTIIETYDGSGGFVLRGNGSKWQAFAMFSSASSHTVISVTSIVLNQWTHVAATFNETTNVLKIYVNGVLDATNSAATIDQRGSLQPIKLGARGDDSAILNEHIQDEVRIWNVERTAQEIGDNMSSFLTGSETGLVAYYGYNDLTFAASNMIIEDLTSNANNGTIIGTYAQVNFVSGANIDNGSCAFQMTTELTITGGDNAAPTVTVQDITIQLDAAGNASITESDIDNGSSDNCTSAANLNLSLDFTAFTCADIGANAVILTVTDESGNENTMAATVTVEDVADPVAIAQDITIQLDADGNASITTADIDNGSSDNCTSELDLVLALDKTSFTCSDMGANTVTLTVTDASGNEASSQVTVTVEESTLPTALAQDLTLELDENGNASIIASQLDNGSSDNCTDMANLSLSLDQSAFSCSDLGVNTVTLTITDESGNSTTATSTVTVEDNQTPTAIVQDITVRLDVNNMATITADDIDNSSADNCSLTLSLDIDSFDETNLGTNTVILTAEDLSGNTSTATATVIVEEYKLDQTIAFETLADQTFGDADFDLAATSNSGLAVSYAIISGPATLSGNVLSITGAGDITIEATQAGDEDYLAADPAQVTFTVNKATLTVTADDKTISYLDEIPSFTFTYNGFVNEESASVLTTEPAASTSATGSSDAGSYAIVMSGGSADNYSITLVDGTFTIAKADVQITITDLEYTIDGEPKSPTITTTPADLNFTLTFDGSTEAPSEIGQYAVVVTIDEQNYMGTEQATLVIQAILGLEVENELQINIYPNPAINQINIVLENGTADRAILYDMNGVEVKQFAMTLNQNQVDVSTLRTGIYLLVMLDENLGTLQQQKIVIGR